MIGHSQAYAAVFFSISMPSAEPAPSTGAAPHLTRCLTGKALVEVLFTLNDLPFIKLYQFIIVNYV